MGREKNSIPYWMRLTDISSYIKKLEDIWRNHYNIYVYNILRYPPDYNDEKKCLTIFKTKKTM